MNFILSYTDFSQKKLDNLMLIDEIYILLCCKACFQGVEREG